MNGGWLVAWECKCDPRGQGLDRVHYIFGPFPTPEAAEEWARQQRAKGHDAKAAPMMRPL